MRAAVLRAYRADLAIEQLAEPECPVDGVVLQVLACGVCRSDYHGWAAEHARVKPGRVDLRPMVAREIALSQVTAELRGFAGPTSPGVAVITDFTA